MFYLLMRKQYRQCLTWVSLILLLCPVSRSRRPDESPRTAANNFKDALRKLSEKERETIYSMVDGGVTFEDVRMVMMQENPAIDMDPLIEGFAAQRQRNEGQNRNYGSGNNKKKRNAAKKNRSVRKPGNSASGNAKRPRPPQPPSKSSGMQTNIAKQSKEGRAKAGPSHNEKARINTDKNKKVSRRGIADGESLASQKRTEAKTSKPASRSARVKQGGDKEERKNNRKKVSDKDSTVRQKQPEEKYMKPSITRSKNARKKQKTRIEASIEETSTRIGGIDINGEGSRSSENGLGGIKGKSETNGRNPKKKKKRHVGVEVRVAGWPELTTQEMTASQMASSPYLPGADYSSDFAKIQKKVSGQEDTPFVEASEDRTTSEDHYGAERKDVIIDSGGEIWATVTDSDIKDGDIGYHAIEEGDTRDGIQDQSEEGYFETEGSRRWFKKSDNFDDADDEQIYEAFLGVYADVSDVDDI